MQTNHNDHTGGSGAIKADPTDFKRIGYLQMDNRGPKLCNIDARLCSHIILASVCIDAEGSIKLRQSVDSAVGEQSNHLAEVSSFKRRNNQAKVLISITNDLSNQNSFFESVMCLEKRAKFARNIIDFLHSHNLDGVDLDWEHSSNFSANFINREQDRIGFTKFVQALRTAFVENFYARQVSEQRHMQKDFTKRLDNNGMTATVEPYLITVAIGNQESMLDSIYDLRQLTSLCDWFNVKSYDYFSFRAYAPFTGPNAPLNSIVDPYVPILSKMSVAWTLSRLLAIEVPRDKIVMGIPTYARAYKLVFRQTNPPRPFTLAVGTRAGKFSDAILNYSEICDTLKQPGTIVEFDSRARVPYLLTDDGYTWVSYENELSVRDKVQFMLENQLAGYASNSLNYDNIEPLSADHPNQAALTLHRSMSDAVDSFSRGCAGPRIEVVRDGDDA